MPWFSADLHTHSCLSPCASLDASPKEIARAASCAGLDMVALTDHNCARNSKAFAVACADTGVAPLFGTEVTTSEEVHCLCIFADWRAAYDFGELVYAHLADTLNDPLRWGYQVHVNEYEEIEEDVTKLLISSTDMCLDSLLSLTHAHGGIFIPAHIDRHSFSLIGQLGFIPPGEYDALEVQRINNTALFGLHTAADTGNLPWPLICNSDAHHPSQVGSDRFLFMSEHAEPDFNGLKAALATGMIRAGIAQQSEIV